MCTPQYFSKIPFAVTYHIHYFNAIHFERKKTWQWCFQENPFVMHRVYSTWFTPFHWIGKKPAWRICSFSFPLHTYSIILLLNLFFLYKCWTQRYIWICWRERNLMSKSKHWMHNFFSKQTFLLNLQKENWPLPLFPLSRILKMGEVS